MAPQEAPGAVVHPLPAMTDQDRLQDLRRCIDELDDELLRIINRRGELAQEVARIKGAQADNGAYYRPEREAQVLRRITEANPGPLPDADVARLFREVMSACLALEQPLSVGYLGPEGTFTHNAVLKHFGRSVQAVALDAIDEVFREVESGACHYGVVPVENSIEGGVNQTLDMFLVSSVKICGEVVLPIHHKLLSMEADTGAVVRLYGHQQALAQCRRWLDHHLPRAERVPVSSNAEAARRASGEPGAGAIAGAGAAQIYGLASLAEDIEDEPSNTTRFLVVGRQAPPPSGEDKTSLLFSMPNRAGALYHMLGALAEHGVSMTRIESRPSRRGAWEYVYFVDIEGHAQESPIAEALEALQERASMFKLLGAYPRMVL